MNKPMKKIFWVILILFVLAGCDVQYGEEKRKDQPPTLEKRLAKVELTLKQMQCKHTSRSHEIKYYQWCSDHAYYYKVYCEHCGKHLKNINEEEYLKIKAEEAQQEVEKIKDKIKRIKKENL